jgi:predicted transcriptional regulator
MSVATTVKLTPALKKRIAPLAKAAGKTAHAWMVDALAQQVEHDEAQARFVAAGLESYAAVSRGEPVYEAGEVFDFLKAKLAGKKARRPAARKLPGSGK